MKKGNEDLKPVYTRQELGPGMRGKYLEAYNRGSNIVLLSPDVAEAFPTEEAVNSALRSLITIARQALVSGKSSVTGLPKRGTTRYNQKVDATG